MRCRFFIKNGNAADYQWWDAFVTNLYKIVVE